MIRNNNTTKLIKCYTELKPPTLWFYAFRITIAFFQMKDEGKNDKHDIIRALHCLKLII